MLAWSKIDAAIVSNTNTFFLTTVYFSFGFTPFSHIERTNIYVRKRVYFEARAQTSWNIRLLTRSLIKSYMKDIEWAKVPFIL